MNTIRICKATLTALVASYITLVVINNLQIPDINMEYVRHVMSMDTVPEHHQVHWRAVNSPALHKSFFVIIVILEALSSLLCWVGAWKMLVRKGFIQGLSLASSGLVLAMSIWFGVFFVAGGEWFQSWPTPWGSLPSAIRVITILGITLIFINLPENQITE